LETGALPIELLSFYWREPVAASRRLRSAGSLRLAPLRGRFVGRSTSLADPINNLQSVNRQSPIGNPLIANRQSAIR
jgi:hypothetical protein